MTVHELREHLLASFTTTSPIVAVFHKAVEDLPSLERAKKLPSSHRDWLLAQVSACSDAP
jgi:ribonuclease D